MSKTKNTAKWQKIDDNTFEIKQCAVRYTISMNPAFNKEHVKIILTLKSDTQEGTLKHSELECVSSSFMLTENFKQACIDEMKLIGKSMFDDSFEYLYGKCECNQNGK